MSEKEPIVTFDENLITCRRPSGLIESVKWDGLQAVMIQTTEDGPFFTDVFWLLVGKESGCVIPVGSIGEEKLLERLQELPDFDNQVMIDAMGCTDENRFLCWRKS